MPLYAVASVQVAQDRHLLQRRFQTILVGLFSATALPLASVGIDGFIQ